MGNLILLGAPGSGKGTQVNLIRQNFDFFVVSVGDILRDEVEADTNLGKRIKRYMNKGELVPDSTILESIEDRICKSNKNFILDGFPRNIVQANALDKILKINDISIDFVFYMKVSSDVLIKRITGRFSCKDCKAIYNSYFNNVKKKGVCNLCKGLNLIYRSDDKEEVLTRRIEIYQENIESLLEFYQKKNLVYQIDGLQNIDSIFYNIKRIINLN